MMLGAAIAARAIGAAGRRVLASEQTGPRPAGTSETNRIAADPRDARATRP
ncbi:MAG: hypothetical protein KF780_11715 [Sphingomonas sp.]|nr:hypothetical protein [Sphingomonas sp.]